MAIINQMSRVGSPGSLDTVAAYTLITSEQVSLATLSYSIPIAGAASFYATGFKDLHNDHSYGVAFGISLALGPSISASAGGSLDSGRPGVVADPWSSPRWRRTTSAIGCRIQEGLEAQHLAVGEFLSRWGRLTGGVEQSSGQRSVQGGWSGALVWTDGHLFASDQINDSFAVVNTGGVAGVPVLYENRPVGTTNSAGHLLVPSLLSYQNNRVAVDATRLPPDIDVGQTSVVWCARRTGRAW